MNINYRKLIKFTLICLDLLIMAFSFFVAACAVASEVDLVPFTQFFSLRLTTANFILLMVFALFWHLALSFSGAYYLRRLVSWQEETKDIIFGASIGTIGLLIFSMFFDIRLVTPFFLLVFWLLTGLITILLRVFLKIFLARLWTRGLNLHNTVIVGTNSRAVKFAQNLDGAPELGYRVVGFVDMKWPGNRRFKQSGYPLLADFNTFPTYLRTHPVDEVIIDLPLSSFYHEVSYLVGLCVQQGIIVRFLSDSLYLLFDMSLARTKLEEVQDHVVISVYTGAMGGWPILAKRALDLLGSLVLIMLLSPLLLLVAFLIKLTSPRGPVFFIQDRIGLRKHIFKLIKFRTMVPDAENQLADLEQFNEASGPVFKLKHDPRVTFLGRFLRQTSLDELPQLFNVFKGDMSLVGPRPLPVRDYQGFSRDWHRRRFSVKPGITCLWQVDARSSLGTSFDKWMKMDMEYIDHWSLGLDLKILARTIPAVLKGRGAY
jgi:exopolysaccharide biosynthesis polyprenyl glycosylphosphotransferase